MADRFAGRVAFVAGAGGALGGAVARGLAREGARLALFDRNAEALAAVAASFPGALTLVGDATSAADVAHAAQKAKTALGPVELLVSATGIVGPSGPVIDVDEADWDRVFAVNVKSGFLAARYFIPQMRELGRGSVVLFSSTAGLQGSPALSVYAASKGAVVLLTKSLALNHATQNIRVNCVCPGAIESPMNDRAIASAGDAAAQQARAQYQKARHPMNRFGAPQEVAEAVLYLLSDAASFTTGDAPYSLFSIKAPRPIFTNEHMLSVYKEEFREIYRWGGLFDMIFHPQVGGRPSRIALIRELIAFIRTFPNVWFATGAEVAEAWAREYEA